MKFSNQMFTLLLLMPLLLGCNVISKKEKQWYVPKEKRLLIAHGLGGIQGLTYTNSKEAFLTNYAQGKRWFEVDLFLLKDGNLVCYHGGFEQHLGLKKGEIGSLNTKEFLQLKFDNRFTLISFEDLLKMVKAKKNAYVVTDTKGWDQGKMDALLKHIKNVDPGLISRIVPQIYQPDDITLIKSAEASAGKFHSVIFTLYMTRVPNSAVLPFVIREEIPMVTIPAAGWRISVNFLEALHQQNKYVFIHTVNDAAVIERWKQFGVDGFYTDFYQ